MKRAVCLFLVLLMALGVVCAEGEERSRGSFHYRLNGDGTAVLTRYGRALGVTELEIPCTLEGSAVTAIGDRAFADCDWLTKIVVPEGVTSIGEEAFSGCAALQILRLPSTLSQLAPTAFDGCDSLSVEQTSDHFYYRVTDGKATVTGYVREKGVSEIRIPVTLGGAAVTAIGARAFAGCGWLTAVEIPEGVTSVGEEAFSGCKALKTVQKPASLTSVAETAFDGCDSLKKTAAEPQTEPERHNYVLNTNTKKFHRTGCGSIKQMKDKNKKTFYGTREEVIKKGYSPCKKCNP